MIETTDGEIVLAVVSLKKKFPQLTIDYLSRGGPYYKPYDLNPVMLDALAHRSHIPHCRAWLRKCGVRKTFNRHTTTYNYKHRVEEAAGTWISHTSFFIAAELEGLDLVADENGDGLMRMVQPRRG